MSIIVFFIFVNGTANTSVILEIFNLAFGIGCCWLDGSASVDIWYPFGPNSSANTSAIYLDRIIVGVETICLCPAACGKKPAFKWAAATSLFLFLVKKKVNH